MKLLFADLALIFPEHRGIEDDYLAFQTVSAFADINQSKGLFIPLYADSGELKTAIDQGAIAALWQKEVPLPAYIPNHFPVFYVYDLWKGLIDMIVQYERKLEKQNSMQNETAWFVLSDKNSLNEKQFTHDISVIAKELNLLYQQEQKGGRE